MALLWGTQPPFSDTLIYFCLSRGGCVNYVHHFPNPSMVDLCVDFRENPRKTMVSTLQIPWFLRSFPSSNGSWPASQVAPAIRLVMKQLADGCRSCRHHRALVRSVVGPGYIRPLRGTRIVMNRYTIPL